MSFVLIESSQLLYTKDGEHQTDHNGPLMDYRCHNCDCEWLLRVVAARGHADMIDTDERALAVYDGLVSMATSYGELPPSPAMVQARNYLQLRLGDGGWQPIATAPKDGTAVLISGGTYSDFGDKCFDDVAIASYSDRDKEWIGEMTGYNSYMRHKPTQWQPLPSLQEMTAVPTLPEQAYHWRLIHGFMLDCNAIGPQEAGVDLARRIKESLVAQMQNETPAPGSGEAA